MIQTNIILYFFQKNINKYFLGNNWVWIFGTGYYSQRKYEMPSWNNSFYTTVTLDATRQKSMKRDHKLQGQLAYIKAGFLQYIKWLWR